jgi:hypothetical protein
MSLAVTSQSLAWAILLRLSKTEQDITLRPGAGPARESQSTMKETALIALAIGVGASIAAVLLVLCSRRRSKSAGLDAALDVGPLIHLVSPASGAASSRIEGQPSFPSSAVATFPVPLPVAAALVEKHSNSNDATAFAHAFEDILTSVKASPSLTPGDGRWSALLNLDVSGGHEQRRLLWEAFLGLESPSPSSSSRTPPSSPHGVTPGLVRMIAKIYKQVVLSRTFAEAATSPTNNNSSATTLPESLPQFLLWLQQQAPQPRVAAVVVTTTH